MLPVHYRHQKYRRYEIRVRHLSARFWSIVALKNTLWPLFKDIGEASQANLLSMNYPWINLSVNSPSSDSSIHEVPSLKRGEFWEKIWISFLNKKWMFLQNWHCSRKSSMWVDHSGRWSLIWWRPLTRFRFCFWRQFNGHFFDRLVTLFLFS